MDLNGAINRYSANFTTALAFALLLVFVFPFFALSSSFVSSTTIFIDYGFINQPLLQSLALLILALVFLFCYSILVSLMVFSVRSDLSNVKVNSYLNEKIYRVAFKYFIFLAVFTVIASIVSAFLISVSVPIEIINLILLVVSASFMFLPQTLVVDEESLRSSVLSNWEFIAKNFGAFVSVFVFGVISVFVLNLLEFGIDQFVLAGNFVSLLLALVFVLPFIEVIKTQIYMHRFGIVKSYHPSG